MAPFRSSNATDRSDPDKAPDPEQICSRVTIISETPVRKGFAGFQGARAAQVIVMMTCEVIATSAGMPARRTSLKTA